MPRRPAVATPARLRASAAALAAAEPRFAPVIAAAGPCQLHRTRRRHTSHFVSLASSIVYQQLSGTAAATIFARFAALFPKDEPTAEHVARLSDAQLRGAGLSGAKVAAVRDLAAHVRAEALPLDRVDTMRDDDIVEALVQVHGIGPWTAQMFLMFRLGRLDVWPTLDLGVQKGVQRVLRLRQLPTPKRLESLGAPWAPNRSVAAWYAWRALEVT
jgi:DNA-3-methyladenine glycosylase II